MMLVNRLAVLAVFASLAAAVPAIAAEVQASDRGVAVFTAQKCALCHSLEGKGNAKGPLDEVGSKLTADQIRQWLLNTAEMTAKAQATRKPPMRAYPNLPKDDLEALVTFLAAKKKK